MTTLSRPGRPIRTRFCVQGGFLEKYRKNRSLSRAWPLSPVWVIIFLSLFMLQAVGCAGDGENLLKAAFAGDLAKVRTLLEKGTDIEYQDGSGVTALMAASSNGHKGIVQALLAKGAETDLQNKNGVTALYIASQNGHEGIVQALLDKGAETDLQTKMV